MRVLDGWLPDDLTPKIAAENNLAEAAVAKPHAGGDWGLRWCLTGPGGRAATG